LQTTTGMSPAFWAVIPSLGYVYLFNPVIAERVEANQLRQKKQYYASAVDYSFKVGDSCL